MWKDWTNILSSDQILSAIKGLDMNLENQEGYKEIFELYTDLENNQYMDLLLRNFFYSYKNGDINLALSNRVNFDELYQLKEKKKVKKSLNFNHQVSICQLNEYETKTYNSVPNLSLESKFFMTCTSAKEAELFKLPSNENKTIKNRDV